MSDALKRIAERLRRAGASVPAPENKGTIESAMATGLSIALLLIEQEIEEQAGITRKPLTDEEIMDICKETSMLMWDEVDGYSIRGFARAIEAAHGITPQAGKESGDV